MGTSRWRDGFGAVRVAGAVALVAVLAAGCSDAGAREDYVLAVAGTEEPTRAVRCTAGSLVDAVGVAELEDAGVEPEELGDGRFVELMELELVDIAALSETMAELLAARECGLAADVVLGGLQQLADEEPEAQQPQISDEGLACLDAYTVPLGDLFLRSTVDEGYEFDAELDAVMRDAVLGCPDALAEGFASLAGADEEARRCFGLQLAEMGQRDVPPPSRQLFREAAEACDQYF